MVIAILLHLITAIAMGLLAYFKISSIGAYVAIIAVCLTFVRPAIRMHEYVAERLARISVKVKFPREDVVQLLSQVNNVQTALHNIQNHFSTDSEYSTISKLNNQIKQLQEEIRELRLSLKSLEKENQNQHDNLSRTATDAIAQLSEDGRFLNQMREIISFVKKNYVNS